MKKITSIVSVLLITTFLFNACNSNTSATSNSTKDSTNKDSIPVAATVKDSTPSTNQKVLLAATEIYTCSMHQEVIGNKPGHCSVCGMELVKQKPTDQQKKLIKDGTYTNPKD